MCLGAHQPPEPRQDHAHNADPRNSECGKQAEHVRHEDIASRLGGPTKTNVKWSADVVTNPLTARKPGANKEEDNPEGHTTNPESP